MRLARPQHVLHYEVAGTSGPWLVMCNSLGADLHMWDAQVPVFARDRRVLRYDRRGHGHSTAPAPPYSIAALAEDVLALLDELAIERADFCGLSIGGLVGQWLASHTARLDRLVVTATAARIGTPESWRARINQVVRDGLAPLVPATRDRWFSPAFVDQAPEQSRAALAPFARVDPAAYIGCCEALAAADLTDALPRISAPVLAISGADDAVCPPMALQAIADAVPRGRHVSLPGRHLVNIESAAAYASCVTEFLREPM